MEQTFCKHLQIHAPSINLSLCHSRMHTSIHLSRDARRKSRHKHFKTCRWPLGAIYLFLLDSSISNAFVLCRDANRPNLQNAQCKQMMVDEILSLLQATDGKKWTIEDALSTNEEGERRFLFDEVDCLKKHQRTQRTPSESCSGSELAQCFSTEVASLSPEEVERKRLMLAFRHWSIKCPKRAPCVMHKKRRLRTFFHCLDCGVPLHPGVCHRIFHSISDLSSVDEDLLC